MKTSFLATALFVMTASGVAVAQSTTISTNPKQKMETDSASSAGSTQGERKTTDGAGHQNKDNASQPGRATGAGNATQPGGKDNSTPNTDANVKGDTKLPANQNKANTTGGDKKKQKPNN